MHGKHKDTHIEEPIFVCQGCGRIGDPNSFTEVMGEDYCPGCNSRHVKELEDES